MKIIFLGLGSIGQRHLRLIQEKFPDACEILALRTRASDHAVENRAGIRELSTWDEVEKSGADVAFVCNPTSLHIETALRCARGGMNLFLEKPIANNDRGLAELLDTVRQKKLTAYVAYPLRFHPGIEALREQLRPFAGAPGHARFVASSYLPDWRPGRDHKKGYSSFHEMGGGVVLDLSHEFDLAAYLFGHPSVLTGRSGRVGQVTVDSEDFANALMTCGRTQINVHLNFMSRLLQRTVEVDVGGHYFKLDLLAGELTVRTAAGAEVIAFGTDKDAPYRKQIDYFFSNLKNASLMNNLEEASGLFQMILNYRKESRNES